MNIDYSNNFYQYYKQCQQTYCLIISHNFQIEDVHEAMDVAMSDKNITSRISNKKMKKIFDYSSHLKNVNLIFGRVFK